MRKRGNRSRHLFRSRIRLALRDTLVSDRSVYVSLRLLSSFCNNSTAGMPARSKSSSSDILRVAFACAEAGDLQGLTHACEQAGGKETLLEARNEQGEVREEEACAYPLSLLSISHTHSLEYRYLLFFSCSRIPSFPRFSQTLLHVVCMHGHLSLALFLLDPPTPSSVVLDAVDAQGVR